MRRTYDVDCEGGVHRVMVDSGRKRVVLLDHNVKVEMALVGLGGEACGCLVVGLRIRWFSLPFKQTVEEMETLFPAEDVRYQFIVSPSWQRGTAIIADMSRNDEMEMRNYDVEG